MQVPLREVAGPDVLPPFVSSCSAVLGVDDHRRYFDAGRRCAAQAIRQLGIEAPPPVPRGASGEPLWAEGLTGSITHKDGYVWAAAAQTRHALGIGIDAERLIDDGCAERISKVVVLPRERDVGGDALPHAMRVALLFSVKESVFKCLYPLVRRRFYYQALEVRTIDVSAGTFQGVLVERLSDAFGEGHVLDGRFAADRERVYTSLVLEPDPPKPFAGW